MSFLTFNPEAHAHAANKNLKQYFPIHLPYFLTWGHLTESKVCCGQLQCPADARMKAWHSPYCCEWLKGTVRLSLCVCQHLTDRGAKGRVLYAPLFLLLDANMRRFMTGAAKWFSCEQVKGIIISYVGLLSDVNTIGHCAHWTDFILKHEPQI